MRNAVRWGYRVVRWLLSALFVYAGFVKLMEPARFARTISDFGLLPESTVLAAAVLISLTEALAGSALLFDFRGSLTVITGLIVLFLLVVGYGLWLGLQIDCGCFGASRIGNATDLTTLFWRDLLLLSVCGGLYAVRKYGIAQPKSWRDIRARTRNAGTE